MAIQQYNDGDQEAKRKRVVGLCLVGLVEGVRFAEFALMMFKLLLLFRCQDGKLPLFLWVVRIGSSGSRYRGVLSRQVVVVG